MTVFPAVEDPPIAPGTLLHIKPKHEKDRVRLRTIPQCRTTNKAVTVRCIVEFRMFGPLNMAMWKKLKLPKGWRKSPRRPWMAGIAFPVRIYSYHPASISAVEMENLEAQLRLITGSPE